MSTLDDIAALLEDDRDLEVAPTRHGGLGVTWREGERTRRAVVHEGPEGTTVVAAAICREREADPRRALALSARLAAGGIALLAGAYFLRCTLPRGRRDPASLRALLHHVTAEAARLEQVLSTPPGAAPDEVFTLYDA